LALARHNAVIYGVEDRIEFILADYLSFADSYLRSQTPGRRKIDVVFLSPPWGGPEYLAGTSEPAAETDKHPEFELASMKPIHGAELFKLSRKITQNIAYYVPRNTKLEEISELLTPEESERQKIEVEEEWMGPKLKALTCYFGGLAQGQEQLFDE
jgi:trimethylguanosine synthase